MTTIITNCYAIPTFIHMYIRAMIYIYYCECFCILVASHAIFYQNTRRQFVTFAIYTVLFCFVFICTFVFFSFIKNAPIPGHSIAVCFYFCHLPLCCNENMTNLFLDTSKMEFSPVVIFKITQLHIVHCARDGGVYF